MSRATRVTGIVLVATMLGAACKSDEKKETAGPTFPADWKPPNDDFVPDAGAPKKATPNVEGWLVVDPGADKLVLVSQAIVKLSPADGRRGEGTVWLTQTSDGLKIKLEMKGLTFMQKYGLRVHLLGDCSGPDFESAGPPMNFQGSSLADDNPPGTGLLGELKASVEGDAKGETVANAALQGHYSIIGRSIVLHDAAGSKDPLGARIACGVIGVFADLNAIIAPPQTLDPGASKKDLLGPFDQRPSR